MVKTYSNKQDGACKLSAHFRVREFARAGVDEVKVDDELIQQLEDLYKELGCSKIIITSGYRPADTGSQHALGKAADVNCWHKVGDKEERYQGREILLAAEKVGIRGIGWIAGTAQSRAAVHLDTRATPYRFDEADGNRKVKDNSWYAYFGVEKPGGGAGTYTVVAGDSLSKIGATLGVPWKEIAAANGIEDPWIIRPGQVLTIPGGSGETGDGETAEKPAAHNPYAEPTALLQSGSRGDGVRWVQWELDRLGYDLGSGGIDGIFGAKTDAGVRAIQKAAGIVVDGKVGPDTRKALKNAGGSGDSGAPDQPSKPGTYTVAAGDSLSKIGANLGVPWKEIAAANGIEDPWIIRPGQVLTIPGGAGAPNKPSKPGTYTVAAGDSLSKIGANLGVPWKEIAAANGIEDPWIIRPGQVLTIPER